MATLILQRSGPTLPDGLDVLTLSRLDGSGHVLATLEVNSGQPFAQQFVTAGAGFPGNMEPIEEGYWSIGAPEWAGASGDYSASWSAGVGPVFVPINPMASNATRRSEFGFHLDANRATAPGSAGCVVFVTLSDLQTFVGWFGDGQGVPDMLVVDWGLGSVSVPATAPTNAAGPPRRRLKVFAHDDKVSVLSDGRMVDATDVHVWVHDGKVGTKLNNAMVATAAMTVDLVYTDAAAAPPTAPDGSSPAAINQLLEQAATQYGIDPDLLKAVAWQESRWNPNASSFDGGHGKGVMQIDDRFHAFALTPAVWDAAANIQYGAQYLGSLFQQTGSWQEALLRYNGSPDYPPIVMQWTQQKPWRSLLG